MVANLASEKLFKNTWYAVAFCSASLHPLRSLSHAFCPAHHPEFEATLSSTKPAVSGRTLPL